MKKAKPDPVPAEFVATHAALRRVLEPFAKKKGMVVAKDGPGEFLVLAPPNAKYPQYPKGLWFVCTRVGKAYVSFHLMPIYRCPDLAKKIPPALKKRMQGNACFNFKTPDPALFRELSVLTKAAYERWRKEGLV